MLEQILDDVSLVLNPIRADWSFIDGRMLDSKGYSISPTSILVVILKDSQQTGKHHRNWRMLFRHLPCLRWNAFQFLIACSVLLRGVSCSATTCEQGYEYRCQWVTNSTGCIHGCNATIAEILAPGESSGGFTPICWVWSGLQLTAIWVAPFYFQVFDMFNIVLLGLK